MRSFALGLVSAAAGACTLLLPGLASAAAPGGTTDDNLVSYQPPQTERRGGFAMGLTSGLSLINFSGYPNVAVDIGNPDALQQTGPSMGTGIGIWAGGSIRDWLTFGVGIASSTAWFTDYQASSAAFVLHVEAFPFYYLGGGHFRDLGVSLDGGPSVASMYAADDTKLENILADGGLGSFLALTAFYEPFRFWHFSTGPAVTFGQTFSQTMTVTQGVLAWRFVFYGEQPQGQALPRASARGGLSGEF